MSKNWVFILLFVIAAVVLYLVFDYVTREGMTNVFDPRELQRIERGSLAEEDMVVVTLEDNLYHIEGCEYISGTTQKMVFRVARTNGATACPHCIKE